MLIGNEVRLNKKTVTQGRVL